MIRSIRAGLVMMLAATAAAAQSGAKPPTPPTPPTPRPVPRVRSDVDFGDMRIDLGDMRLQLGDLQNLRLNADEIRQASLEASRAAIEASRDAMRQSQDATREAMAQARMSLDQLRIDGFPSNFGAFTRSGGVVYGERYQGDPADSLYRQASFRLNESDYRAAAQRFKELQQKFPNSQYINQAMYLQAFSLYRAGSDAELREALGVLDDLVKRAPSARAPRGLNNSNIQDVPSLQLAIRKVQAARGDAAARQQISAAASGGNQPCDREEQQVQAEALSGLMQIDPEAAASHLETILSRKDDCSLQLRQNALQILGRRGDDKSVALLISIAKNDPSSQMRSTAVEYLARVQSDDVYSTLESMARNETNENVRRAAARNLVGYPSTRARQLVRTLIEDNTIPDGVRTDMLNRFNEDRGSTDDAVWLRAAYAKVTSNNVKSAIVRAIGRINDKDSQKWLMDLSTNDNEAAAIRSDAFRYVATSMTVADLSRAYDNTGSRPTRLRIVEALNRRKEPEALDKLIDIVKKGSDTEVRRQVINMLSDRKDPKVTQLLLDLISK